MNNEGEREILRETDSSFKLLMEKTLGNEEKLAGYL